MAQKAVFTWTKSASTVTKQVLVVNGTTTELAPDIQSFTTEVADGAAVHAELWVTDGVLNSPHVTVDATAPVTPVPPAAPTDFKVAFEQV